MNDEKIIALFFERSEQAIAELDCKYGAACRSVSFHILGNREDAEECVNDAYLGVWNAIPPAKPHPLLSFVCKIVRNVSLKRYEYNTAVKRNSHYDLAMEELEDFLASSSTVEAELAKQELTALIEAFLDTLSREDRVIFLRRYWFAEPYNEIAEKVGLSEKNVSVRLVRIRKRLRSYLLEREVFV
jgi:RNA polymerase sigma-70 factor (ECF subfamily)